MAHQYLKILFELTHDLLLDRASRRPINKAKQDQIRQLWMKCYYDARDFRPYWQQIQLAMTGVANQTVIGRTPTIDQDIVIAGLTSNAPAAGQLISLQNETTRQDYQVNPTPPTALFGDVQRTTERYFPVFPQIYQQANNRLKLTAKNDATAPITQTVTYSLMGTTAIEPSLARTQYDLDLDADVALRIEQMITGDPAQMIPAQPFILQMDVPFTNTASERVLNRRTEQFSRPLLIFGAQHDFAAKETIALLGPTAQFTSMDQRYVWSLEEQFIWSFADAPTEPEQWIMFPRPILVRPNSQIQGNFTNGTAGGTIGTGTFHVFFYCIQL